MDTVSKATGKRWETHASTYDVDAPKAVACYRHLHAEILRHLSFPTEAPIRVMDLGAGGGRLLSEVLKRFPNSQAVWVDSSPVMRVVAGRRLARYNGRVTWLEASFDSSAWESVLEGGADAIVSSIAMHHLPDEQKQLLFQRIYRALRPGGVVAIADEVLGGTWSDQKGYLQEWDQRTQELSDAQRLSPRWMELWQIFRDRVFPDPEHNPTERWAPAAQQAAWLRDAGFTDTRVWWEHAMWAVFGGRKE